MPSGHSREAASELELGAFTEYSDRGRALYDNKSECADRLLRNLSISIMIAIIVYILVFING
jgi:hypothetical protein